MISERLQAQLSFLREIDALKRVIRRTYLLDGSRLENSAEHSWHMAMLVTILAEYAGEPIEWPRTLKMVLMHDIIEVEAGDTYMYDEQGNEDKLLREQQAADHLFALLPVEQGEELRGLWEEFEQRRTPEARFARALDRFHPLLHNYLTRGRSWREHGVYRHQVIEKTRL